METSQEHLISFFSVLVFSFLDLLDFLLCFVYRFLDGILDESPSHCYCVHGGEAREEGSETLYWRRNIFRDMSITSWFKKQRIMTSEGKQSYGIGTSRTRWSDCGCDTCSSWQGKGEERLYVVAKEPAQETCQDIGKMASAESVIFLHGFLSSSSFWTQTVFPNVSESANSNLRMFAVDLLGFGRSPKPTSCSYTIEDHIEQIEKSVIKPFGLNSFHLVAHSMGCILAISLAAKYPEKVKSVTLIAPPYFPSIKEDASYTALNRLAERKIWPPKLFASAIMSWYEHLGRTVCFLVCRNHQTWEWILKLLTWRRELPFMITDLTKHTHHSGWHIMHNVICGGAKLLDEYLEILKIEDISVKLIQGAQDEVVPLECSYNVKSKIPTAELHIVDNANHSSVVLDREKALTRELEDLWFSSGKCQVTEHMVPTSQKCTDTK